MFLDGLSYLIQTIIGVECKAGVEDAAFEGASLNIRHEVLDDLAPDHRVNAACACMRDQ